MQKIKLFNKAKSNNRKIKLSNTLIQIKNNV